MDIKRLSLFLLTALSLMLIGCGNDDGTDDSYVDIVMHVSENTVWNQVRGIDEPKEYMLVKERSASSWQELAIGSIDGFDYVRGHAYELKVRKYVLANPSQGGTKYVYRLLGIISDVTVSPGGVPDEAKFKLKMVHLETFMHLDTPLAAPFDMLKFRVTDNNDAYSPVGFPEFLQYYDSLVVSSPEMPDTYCLYKKEHDYNSASERFMSQFSSYFFVKKDFQIFLKGYKDGEVKYEYKVDQIMRERDFLGIDWKYGDVVLDNPKTSGIYCVLDNRYEYMLTDTQVRNNTPYVEIGVAYKSGLTDAEYIKRQENGLRWLLEEHMGEKYTEARSEFKTVPEGAEVVETYGNATTRAALVHTDGDDLHAERYYIITEKN